MALLPFCSFPALAPFRSSANSRAVVLVVWVRVGTRSDVGNAPLVC